MSRAYSTNAPASSSIPGWQASLSLGFEFRQSRTVLARRERNGPLAIQRPFYPEGERCHVYLLHPPSGIVGGDQLNISISADANTQSLLTTPGANRFYRSDNRVASVEQCLKLANNADVEWLPQETIYFVGCNAQVNTVVQLTGDAAITLWDIQCFGRPANNEPFGHGQVDIQLRVYRDSQPLLLERQRLDADNRTFASTMAGQPVNGVLISTQSTQDTLNACREAIGECSSCALTLIDDLLVARYVGDSTRQARQLLTTIWLTLRNVKCGESAVLPRIWLT